jgi:hypothetical protein
MSTIAASLIVDIEYFSMALKLEAKWNLASYRMLSQQYSWHQYFVS